eukprot:558815-Pyramimonas_sp.AAC.1
MPALAQLQGYVGDPLVQLLVGHPLQLLARLGSDGASQPVHRGGLARLVARAPQAVQAAPQ